VPDNILHFLSLGSNFALPFAQDGKHDGRELVVDVVKNFELIGHKFSDVAVNSCCVTVHAILL